MIKQLEMQQTLTMKKPESMTAKQVAIMLAQKTDYELKREFPVFWELLNLKKQEEE